MPYCNKCGTPYEIGKISCEKCGSALPEQREPQVEKSLSDEIKYSKNRRLIAGTIDLIVAILLGCAFLLIRGKGLGAFLIKKSAPIILPVIYMLLRDCFEGKSVGKIFMNIMVYNEESRKPSGLLDSILRNWVFVIPIIGPLFCLVAAAQIWSGKKKRIGEPASTLVISDDEYIRLK